MSRFAVVLIAVLALTSSARAQNADMGVFKTGPDTATAGSDVSYSITVINNGPDDSVGVNVTDNIPSGMTFTSRMQNSGPAANCSDPGSGNPGSVICSILSFPAGQTATFTFVFHIPNGTSDGTLFINMVRVNAETPDDNPENNTSSVGTSIPASTADIVVTKTGPVSAAPGSNVTYTITINNPSANNATSVNLHDLLPTAETFQSITPTAGCTTPAPNNTGAIDCNVGTITAGTSKTYTLVAQISNGTPSGQLDNTASITSSNDPNEENNTSTASVNVSSVDLSVTKTAPAVATAGSVFTYTITVANAGPDSAANVVMSDPLPAGVVFESLVQNSGPAAICSTPPVDANGTVSCAFDGLPPTTAQFTVSVEAGNITLASNTATVSSDSFDVNQGNNSSTANTTITPVAEVSVAKSAPATVAAGATLTYTLNVTNAGPSNAQNVTLTDVLPANTTFVSFSAPAGWTPSTPAVGAPGTVTASNPLVPPAASATFTIVVRVNSNTAAGTVISDTATVASTTADSNPGNNSSTAVTTTTVLADLALTKSAPATIAAGANLTYTLNLINNGPSDAATVSVIDVIPANTTFVSASTPGGWSVIAPAVGGTGTFSATSPLLQAGASASFTLVVRVNSGTPAGTVISNTANAAAATPDAAPANNSSTATSTVVLSADLSVTKSGAPASVPSGSNITYTITVTNNGPSDASTVTLTDPVPANTTFVSFAAPAGWVPATPPAGGTGTVTATAASLVNGASAVFTLVVKINSGAPSGTIIANTATVSAAPPDPTPGNNSATATTNGTLSTDLAVTKTNTPNPVVPGTNVTYSVTVTNNGPSDAANVSLTDVIPANTTFVSFTAPAGWTNSTPAAGGTGTVTSNNPILTVGSSAAFTLVVRVNSALSAGTTINNTANVTSANTDPTPGNNSASSSTVTAAPVADLAITKTAPSGTFIPQQDITFTISVTNGGPSTATSVAVTDALPANTTLVSVTPSQGTCSGTTTVTCSIGTLAAAGSATISLVIRATAPGPLTNTATVSSAVSDPNPANNSATASMTIAADVPALSPLLLALLAMALAGLALRFLTD